MSHASSYRLCRQRGAAQDKERLQLFDKHQDIANLASKWCVAWVYEWEQHEMSENDVY